MLIIFMVVSFGEPSSPTGSVYINCGRGEGRIVYTELDGHDMTPSSLLAKRRSPHQGASPSPHTKVAFSHIVRGKTPQNEHVPTQEREGL